MAEEREPECQLRRRRKSANPNLPLNFEGYQVSEGGTSQGTPSPSCIKFAPSRGQAAAMAEFRKKQQSFDIQVEECEEEEILIESDGEAGEDDSNERPTTPTPIQDFGANVVYTEGPQISDFLKVSAVEQGCTTDVSDADSDDENAE